MSGTESPREVPATVTGLLEVGEADRRFERLMAELCGRYGEKAQPFLYQLTDAARDHERALLKVKLRAIGEFLEHYGAHGLWKALYVRFGLDVTDAPDAWALGEGYREGDEWRFVHGDSWRGHNAAAAPPTHPAPNAALLTALRNEFPTHGALGQVDREVAEAQHQLTHLEERVAALEKGVAAPAPAAEESRA